MRCRCIIARHQENLQWTENLPVGEEDEVFIVSSGSDQYACLHTEESPFEAKHFGGNVLYKIKNYIENFEYNPLAHIVTVPNIGREAGKWLEYLVRYYDDYADFNIFLQAYPFDHISLNDILTLMDRFKEGDKLDFGYIKGPTLDNIFEHDRWKHNPHGHDQAKIYRAIYKNQMPYRFDWRVGAQFYITKELLQKNQKCYYEKLQEVLYIFDEDGPYCFERSWLTFLINPPQEYKMDYIEDIPFH